MKSRIDKSIKSAKNLDDVLNALYNLFEELRKEGKYDIGFVSGVITSDGKDKIRQNTKYLERITDKVRKENKIPVFSSTDILNEEMFDKLGTRNLSIKQLKDFFRGILASKKKYVTKMFMAPGWERSYGAIFEHELAKKTGMKIVYMDTP
jgi:hypothetical protein